MIITNKSRQKRTDIFVDENQHPFEEYYATYDGDYSIDERIAKVRRLISLDADYFDPYLMLANLLLEKDKYMESIAVLQEAYVRAMRRIVDSKGQWPKEMLWGFVENRHIMRVIFEYAILCWSVDKKEEAQKIFQELLKVNPNDNQGVRYELLALKLGYAPIEWQKPFEAESNGKFVGLKGRELNEWFLKNAQQFPNDFNDFLDDEEE